MRNRFGRFDRISSFVDRGLTGAVDAPPIAVFLTCGAGGENLANNKSMAEALRGQGYPLEFLEIRDAHNWTAWRNCAGPGLEHLLGSPP